MAVHFGRVLQYLYVLHLHKSTVTLEIFSFYYNISKICSFSKQGHITLSNALYNATLHLYSVWRGEPRLPPAGLQGETMSTGKPELAQVCAGAGCRPLPWARPAPAAVALPASAPGPLLRSQSLSQSCPHTSAALELSRSFPPSR